jgi:flagellar assembly protein FliH
MANYNDVHAKILRSGQYLIESTKFVVQAPKVFRKTKEQDVDESTKRIDDLHNEIKNLESEIAVKMEKSEKEADEIIKKAELDAETILKEAEKNAFERVKKSMEEKEESVNLQSSEAERILSEAKEQEALLLKQAGEEAERIKGLSRKEAYEAGRDEGFKEGGEEVKNAVERLHSIIGATIKEREKILVNSERQIINLVLTMVKKIVKKMTDEDNKIVINNVREALTLVRGAMSVFIHVNREDFEFVSRHKAELIKMIEGMPEVKIIEDPAVDRGGVYIETDIGEIDAKISTQLEEIENKIKYYMPVKIQTRMPPAPGGRAAGGGGKADDETTEKEIEESQSAEKSLLDN